MAEVVDFPGVSKLDIPPEKILAAANEETFDEVVVIGFTEDGDFYFASSRANGGDVLWVLERAKHKLMCITDELESGTT